MRYFVALCFALSLLGDQPTVSYTRFCSTCGILGADTIVSQKGQFIVHGSPSRAFPPRRRENEPPLIELEPQIVAVTAERTQRAIVEEVGSADLFRDKVHVVLLSRASPEQPIHVVSHIHSDGFLYQVGLPVYLEGGRLLKALVQVVLQEYANQGATRNAELPSWLVEGMTRQVLSGLVSAPVLNRKPLTVERIGYDRLGESRSFLQTNAPLTIQDLSFANLRGLNEIERLRFEASSHLLVHELLRLNGGRALLGRFMRNLPQALNWQTAFHSAYSQYFRTPLDFEKWWMLSCLEARNRQTRETWGTPTSLERLDTMLRFPMEYRVSTNSIPQRRDASLQEVLTSTDFGVQKDLLGQKLQHLFFLSVNLSPEVAPLNQAYQQAIDSYLQKRALNDYQPVLKSDPEQRLQTLVKSTIKTFNELDQAREEVREGRTPKLPQAPKKAGRQVLVIRESSRK